MKNRKIVYISLIVGILIGLGIFLEILYTFGPKEKEAIIVDETIPLTSISYELKNVEMHDVKNDNRKIANVSQFGAYGDGIHDDTEAIQKALLSGYDLEFEKNATYILSKGLMIPSRCVLKGNGAVLKINEIDSFFYDENNTKENNGKGLFYYQFFMPLNYLEKSECIQWENLQIEWNVEQILNHVDIYYLLMPQNVENIYLKEVNIKVKGQESNCVQPIKFDGSTDKILMDTCDIRNYTHAYAGGCIWFNVGVGGYPDFTLKNSYLYSEARDEVFSMWGRYGEKIVVSDTVIEKNNYLCYDYSRKERKTKPEVVIVSKASQRSKNDIRSSLSHEVFYNNCKFISNDMETTPDYFFTTNSYYGEKMFTYFDHCEIIGNFEIAFMTAETNTSGVDGITNAKSQADFSNALNVTFSESNICVNVPTLATTHCTNFTFNKCEMMLSKCVIDLEWVCHRLINCWIGQFINNTITINNAQGVFLNISDSYKIGLVCENNRIKIVNKDKKYNNKLLTKKECDISGYEMRHAEGSHCYYTIKGNSITQ